MKWAIVALVPAIGCYRVDNSDCAIRCGEDGACPSNLSCVATFCVAEGQTCADPGLVLAYSFDDIEQGTIRDDSLGGNTATVFGDPDLVDAVHGKGLAFSGDRDSLRTPHAPSLAVASGGAFTVEMWLLVEPQQNFMADQIIVGKVKDSEENIAPFYEFGVEFDSSNRTVELFVADDVDFFVAYEMDIPLGEFVHIALTYDGRRAAGFVNGQPASFDAPELDFAIPDYGQDLVIGSAASPQEYLFGALDDLRIYNRALTIEEIVFDKDSPAR